jgi:hypothetical protein
MSLIPPGVRCDRCKSATAEVKLGTDTVAKDWVKLGLMYTVTPVRQIDLCPECVQEVKAAGGLDLRQGP